MVVRRPSLCVFLAVLCLAAALSVPAAAADVGADAALVLYDSQGEWGWLGDLYSQQLANLLGHFPLDVVILPVESYTPGELDQYAVTFYLGSVYGNPLPPGFLDDVLNSVTPVCWFKYNIWQLAWDEWGWHNPAFVDQYGFRFLKLDAVDWDTVLYRDLFFTKDVADAELGLVQVADPDLAEAAAWALRPPYEGAEAYTPYVIRGGNLWYVADIPFTYATASDRYLPFCDLLHDIVGIDHSERHPALIRIEDVSADNVPAELMGVADLLYNRGIPFQVGVTSCYRDPLSEDTSVNPGIDFSLAHMPEVLEAIRYMASRGGTIVAHGYTHQYDSTTNPETGRTSDDYEFYRVTLDGTGQQVYEGPIPGDSVLWAQSRMTAAFRELRSLGLQPAAWEVPHYAATATDFAAFADLGGLMYHRTLYFAEGASGSVASAALPERTGDRRPRPVSTSWPRVPRGRNPFRGEVVEVAAAGAPIYILGQFFPYVIQRDVYGQKLAPENLHYLEPLGVGDDRIMPADLIAWAELNLGIRDGWASCYFHSDVDLKYLAQLVDGIVALGYEYVPISPDME